RNRSAVQGPSHSATSSYGSSGNRRRGRRQGSPRQGPRRSPGGSGRDQIAALCWQGRKRQVTLTGRFPSRLRRRTSKSQRERSEGQAAAATNEEERRAGGGVERISPLAHQRLSQEKAPLVRA